MLYPDSAGTSLDFHVLKGYVAEYTSSRKGRAALLALVPSPDRRQIEPSLLQSDELLQLMERGHFFPAVAMAEVDDALPLLRIQDAVLDAEQFMAIKAQAESYANGYRFLLTHEEDAPMLASHLKPFPPTPDIPQAIDRVFERNGQVKSNASAELSRLRSDLAKKRVAADRLFYKALKRYEAEGWLGDVRESVSNDRRVMAVSASHKSKARGAFHGSSAKNTLIFLEPTECLDINAEVGVLVEEERKEVRRILQALTKSLSPHRHEIKATDERLTYLDILLAKTRFAREEGACLPRISEEGEIELIQAFNPVLRRVQKAKRRPVVPLDLSMRPTQRLIVISGPNAGGKSIALKTVGLFQIMLQCGILIPTHPKSTMAWFGRIMADIGDAQSVENELSTYSGKLTKMKEILLGANQDTLCLVDEFGSGSDPDLGAALASVFLQEIHDAQAYGIFTTHYNSIKALAEELDGTCNANMAFDVQTFEPLYCLQLGVPGSSYTFEVAQRVGIPKRIMKAAREALESQTLAVDRLLVGLQKQRSQLDRTRTQISDRLSELEALKTTQEKHISSLEAKMGKAAENNAEVSDQLMWGKRLEQWSISWSKAKTQKAKKEIEDRIVRTLSERHQVLEVQKQRAETAKQKTERETLEQLWTLPVKVGDKVKVLHGAGRQAGEIQEIRKDKFLVSLGGVLSAWMERKQFIHWDQRPGTAPTTKPVAISAKKNPKKGAGPKAPEASEVKTEPAQDTGPTLAPKKKRKWPPKKKGSPKKT
jgi:DNA mismatch repair protein MutS2